MQRVLGPAVQHCVLAPGPAGARLEWFPMFATCHAHKYCRMRIAYATYKAVLGMPGGERHVAFTRILHRGSPDALMEVWAPRPPAC